MPLPWTTAYPGPTNVYIPAFGGKQTAKLIVSFAQNTSKYPVNRLVTRTPVELLSGHWLVLQPEALARVFTDPNSYVWVDGQPRPQGKWDEQDFTILSYQCIRRTRQDEVGWMTREQAVWDLQETKLQALAQQIMTIRSVNFYNLTLNANNHLASHVKTATAWSNIGGTGGFWSAGTVTNPIIKRSLANAANQIRVDTNNAVNYKDLTLVISPPAAIAMSNSAEIHDYLARSQFALAQIKGEEQQNGEYGLPNKLYDMKLVVDGTLKTSTPRLTIPGTFLDNMDDNTALIMAAPGDLSSNVGQLNSGFSSVHMFVYRGEEMVVETWDEPWNHRTNLGVHETWDFRFSSNRTAALVTNLFS